MANRDEILRCFAKRYIWLELPYDVMETSERIVAQAMYTNLNFIWHKTIAPIKFVIYYDTLSCDSDGL